MPPALHILHIEDDAIDVVKFSKVLNKLQFQHSVTHADNGRTAWALLEGGLRPDIIISDINMPVMNGIEFLTVLRSKTNFNCIPVVIFTTSTHDNDVMRCYTLGISGFVEKPLRHEDYNTTIENLMLYWSINKTINR